MAAAALTVDLNARIAQFETEFKRATGTLDKFDKRGADLARSFNNAMATLGVGLSLAGIGEWIKSTIEMENHMEELSKKTSMTVEALSGLRLVAATSGVSLDDIGLAAGRLQKYMGAAELGNKQFAATLKAMGVDSKDPLVALTQVAGAFDRFADPAQRAVTMSAMLGRSWQNLAPAFSLGADGMKELIDRGNQLAPVTAAMAEQAHEAKIKMEELKLQVSDLSTTLVNRMVPAMNEITSAMIEAAQKGTLLNAVWVGMVGLGAALFTKEFQSDQGRLDDLTAKLDRLQGIAGAKQTGESALHHWFSDANELNKAITLTQTQIEALKGRMAFDKQRSGLSAAAAKFREAEGGSVPIILPKIKTGGSLFGDDPAKRQLDNFLASMQRDVSKEEEILSGRNKMLDLANQSNLLSFQDYFSQRRQAAAEALQHEIADYDKEIAAATAFRDKSAKSGKQKDVADAQGKIDKALDEKAKAERKYAESAVEGSGQEIAAYKGLGNQIEELNIKFLELTDHMGEAAKRAFDLQNVDLRARFEQQGNKEMLDKLDVMKRYEAAQAEVNQMQKEAALITDALAAAEERINIAQQTGAIGELDAMQQLSAARKQSVVELDAVYQAHVKIIQASGFQKSIQDAETFKVSIQKLGAESNLLADKLRTDFTGNLANLFTDLASGAKTAKQAFTDFANSVVRDIDQIIAKQLAESLQKSLFGGTSGGGDFFTSAAAFLFGSSPATAGASMTAAAGGASMGFGGGLADGGPVQAGKWYIAGEKGPEPIWGGGPGAKAMGYGKSGNVSVVNHFSIVGPADTRTQQQIANAAGRSVRMAMARNS